MSMRNYVSYAEGVFGSGFFASRKERGVFFPVFLFFFSFWFFFFFLFTYGHVMYPSSIFWRTVIVDENF